MVKCQIKCKLPDFTGSLLSCLFVLQSLFSTKQVTHVKSLWLPGSYYQEVCLCSRNDHNKCHCTCSKKEKHNFLKFPCNIVRNLSQLAINLKHCPLVQSVTPLPNHDFHLSQVAVPQLFVTLTNTCSVKQSLLLSSHRRKNKKQMATLGDCIVIIMALPGQQIQLFNLLI